MRWSRARCGNSVWFGSRANFVFVRSLVKRKTVVFFSVAAAVANRLWLIYQNFVFFFLSSMCNITLVRWYRTLFAGTKEVNHIFRSADSQSKNEIAKHAFHCVAHFIHILLELMNRTPHRHSGTEHTGAKLWNGEQLQFWEKCLCSRAGSIWFYSFANELWVRSHTNAEWKSPIEACVLRMPSQSIERWKKNHKINKIRNLRVLRDFFSLESWSWILCDRSNGTQITTDSDLFTFIWPINPKKQRQKRNTNVTSILTFECLLFCFYLNATAFQRLWQNHKPVEGEFRWTSFFFLKTTSSRRRHFRFYSVENLSIS